MKKLLMIFLSLSLLLALALPVHADVIWEPYGDKFFEHNRENFSYAGYAAYGNSPSGSVAVYDKPHGKVTDTLNNGQVVYIQYIYTPENGERWALLNYSVDGEYMDGQQYVLLSDLMNRYDEEFFSEHAGRITEEKPEGVACTVPEDGQFAAYIYPNGPSYSQTNYWEEDLTQGMSSYYTDEEGKHWGYVGYWYGRQNVWVCLDDPTNLELSQPEIFLGTVYWDVETGEARPDPNASQAAEPVAKTTVWYYVLPAAAVVVSVALLVLWPKKKKEQ